MNKIYKMTNENWNIENWYDRYDAFIVVASSEEEATQRVIDKCGDYDDQYDYDERANYPKVMPEEWHQYNELTKFTVVGTSELEPQVLLASFNAA